MACMLVQNSRMWFLSSAEKWIKSVRCGALHNRHIISFVLYIISCYSLKMKRSFDARRIPEACMADLIPFWKLETFHPSPGLFFYPSGLQSIKASVKLPSFSRPQALNVIQKVWATSALSTNVLCVLYEEKSRGRASGGDNISNHQITIREPIDFLKNLLKYKVSLCIFFIRVRRKCANMATRYCPCSLCSYSSKSPMEVSFLAKIPKAMVHNGSNLHLQKSHPSTKMA